MKILVARTERSDLYKTGLPEDAIVMDAPNSHFANIGLDDGDEVKIRLGGDTSGYLLIERVGDELHLTRVVYKLKC